MTPFDFSVMPRRSRSYQFVNNTVLLTKQIKNMNSLCVGEVCELSAVIGLYDLRYVSEVLYCSLNKVDRRETVLFQVGINKPFS